MSYTPISPILGIQPIAASSTTQNHPLGFAVDAYDATFGSGTFIYLKGVASTTVGNIVTYDQELGVTTLAPITTPNLDTPLAVAMSANVASQYGWYQVRGAAVIKKTAVAVSPSVPLFLSGTAGRVMPTVAAGRQVMDAIVVTNAATVLSTVSTIVAQIDYPFAQGQIT